MKNVKELKDLLQRVGYPSNISKKEYVELCENIDYVVSPKTGNKITLGTLITYTIPYSRVHSWRDLSRETLTNLLLMNEDSIFYKNQLGFFGA